MEENKQSADALKMSGLSGFTQRLETVTGEGRVISTIVRLTVEMGDLCETHERVVREIFYAAWEDILRHF